MVSFKEFLLMEEEKKIKNENNIVKKLNGINDTLGRLGAEDNKKECIATLTKSKNYKQILPYLCFIYFASSKKTFLEKKINSKDSDGKYIYNNIRKCLSRNGGNSLVSTFDEIYEKYNDELSKVATIDDLIGIFDKNINKMLINDSMNDISFREKKEDLITKIDREALSDEDKRALEEIENKNNVNNKDINDLEELINKSKSHDANSNQAQNDENKDAPKDTPKDETEENQKEDDNQKVNTSSLSSSFSEDDWETLFKEKNEAKIEKILNKVAGNTISKMEKILNDRASQVLKDKDLMEEDAQEELWNVINEKINLGNGSYLERDKGKSVNMYKDGSVGKNDDGSINAGNANKTFEHYKQEIEYMTSNVAGRIAEINGSRSFNSSNGKLNKLRNQVRSVVLDYHNELLDIKNEFDKKISKVGLFQKNKINKARQKEKDDERFNSSEQGEMYGSALKEKTNQIYNAFNSTLKRSQVKTFDDMVAKQIATLAASSMDAKSFAKSCMFKRVLTEDGKTIFVLKYLSNKGIKIPLFDGKDHKQSGLDAKAYSDAFNKFKQELADNEKYSNDSVIKNLVDAINKETPQNKANTEGLDTEANLIRKALKRDQPQDENNDQSTNEGNNQNSQNNNSENNDKFKLPNGKLPETPEEVDELLKTGKISQSDANDLKQQIANNKLRDEGKLLDKALSELNGDNVNDQNKLNEIIRKYNLYGKDLKKFNEQVQAYNDPRYNSTVTTKACDGLPIGARKYSRAIRRRMNYALNKYM